MKPIHSFSSVARFFMLIIFLFGCSQFMSCGSKGGDPGLTVAEQVKAKLIAHSWKVITVTVDGVDKTTLFTNFSITFAATSFTTTNGGLVWPSSSTWSFTDTNATAFTRGDGLIVQLLEATDTSLKMGLTWNKNTFGPGRIESVSGQHVFVMGK